MSASENTNIGTAYDFIAADYDALMQPDLRIRTTLWRHYKRLFQAGDRVLDFGCGTGSDALFLTGLGIQVTGIDASPRMINELHRKAGEAGVVVDARVGAASELVIFPDGGFAGIVSAFAALNTVPDLSVFAAEAHRLLRPAGRLVVHMLAPPGIWEQLKRASEGRWGEARAIRRLRRKTIEVFGKPVTHSLLSAHETYAGFFQDRFQLRRSYSLGFLWPRACDGLIGGAVASLGSRLEVLLGKYPPFTNCGRFFVLDLERRGDLPNKL
jgi:ubiquinone/menaquinone biosynthesis C-methylase UbiE